ncbi:MAG: hypothetical protein GYA51_11930 [Candidatus Methanofastidiosa archaeon]|nr:hypothetical protein [Candidatus Methanofastidiosa archaeon]
MTTIEKLRLDVISTNNTLREVVGNMTVLVLLRNVHPSLRSEYAFELYKEKVLTKDEINEFTKTQK